MYDTCTPKDGRGFGSNGRLKELYTLALDQLSHNMALIEVSMSFREFAQNAWKLSEKFAAHRYLGLLHGNGMVAEYPIILYLDGFEKADMAEVFEPNMTLCLESFVGSDKGGQGVRLDDQILLTEDGIERLTTYPNAERLIGRRHQRKFASRFCPWKEVCLRPPGS